MVLLFFWVGCFKEKPEGCVRGSTSSSSLSSFFHGFGSKEGTEKWVMCCNGTMQLGTRSQ